MTPQDSARIRSNIARINGYDVDALVAIDQELRSDRAPNADTHALIRDVERKSADIVSQAILRATNDGTAFAFARRVFERTGQQNEFTLSDVMGDEVMSGYVRQILGEHADRAAAFDTSSARYQALATRMDGAGTTEALDQAWGDADEAAAEMTVAEFQRLAAIYEAQQAILQARAMEQTEDIAGTEHVRDMANRVNQGVIDREDALGESENILEGVDPARAREMANAQAAERRENDEEDDWDEGEEFDDEDDDLDVRPAAVAGDLSPNAQTVQDAIDNVALGDIAGLVALETRILAMPADHERDDLHSAFERKAGPLVRDVLRRMGDMTQDFQDRLAARTNRRNEFTLMDLVADDEVSVIVREAALNYPNAAPQAAPAQAAPQAAQTQPVPQAAPHAAAPATQDFSTLADRLAADLVNSNQSLEERLMAVINSAPEFAEMENVVPGFRQSMTKLTKAAADIAKTKKA